MISVDAFKAQKSGVGSRLPGVYAIFCVASRKAYIGQSVTIGKRIAEHRSCLRGGAHPNRALQLEWDRHGEESFLFVMLAHLQELHRRMSYEAEVAKSLAAQGACLNGMAALEAESFVGPRKKLGSKVRNIRANDAEWSAIMAVGVARVREWALKTASKLAKKPPQSGQ